METAEKRLLNISHLNEILQKLKKYHFTPINYYRLGLSLGLLEPTLKSIENVYRKYPDRCLSECLSAWLHKADDVKSKGDPSYYTLIAALRAIGENAVADGICNIEIPSFNEDLEIYQKLMKSLQREMKDRLAIIEQKFRKKLNSVERILTDQQVESEAEKAKMNEKISSLQKKQREMEQKHREELTSLNEKILTERQARKSEAEKAMIDQAKLKKEIVSLEEKQQEMRDQFVMMEQKYEEELTSLKEMILTEKPSEGKREADSASAPKAPAIGIDLGTTYSCVQHRKVETIANDQGNRTTPSYVAFTETERLIGDAAKNQVAMNPLNTVHSVKRLIRRRRHCFNNPMVASDCIDEGRQSKIKDEYTCKAKTKSFCAEEISSMVLVMFLVIIVWFCCTCFNI